MTFQRGTNFGQASSTRKEAVLGQWSNCCLGQQQVYSWDESHTLDHQQTPGPKEGCRQDRAMLKGPAMAFQHPGYHVVSFLKVRVGFPAEQQPARCTACNPRSVIGSPESLCVCWPLGCKRRSRQSCNSCRRRGVPGPPRCSCSTCPCSFHLGRKRTEETPEPKR